MKNVTHSTPFNSKKFIAAMSWNVGWLSLLALGIIYKISDSVLLSMIWVSGATQITYIGGQAALDAFVRKAFALSSPAAPPVQESNPSQEPQ